SPELLRLRPRDHAAHRRLRTRARARLRQRALDVLGDGAVAREHLHGAAAEARDRALLRQPGPEPPRTRPDRAAAARARLPHRRGARERDAHASTRARWRLRALRRPAELARRSLSRARAAPREEPAA